MLVIKKKEVYWVGDSNENLKNSVSYTIITSKE